MRIAGEIKSFSTEGWVAPKLSKRDDKGEADVMLCGGSDSVIIPLGLGAYMSFFIPPQLLSGATFVGAIFCFSTLLSHNLYGFLVLFAIGELFVFATQGPVNFVCLHSVKPSLRPLSMAMSTVSIHIFGDVPSSPLVGVVQSYFSHSHVYSVHIIWTLVNWVILIKLFSTVSIDELAPGIKAIFNCRSRSKNCAKEAKLGPSNS
ncbi:hypothetical protein MKW98_017075 [Papaver atlanticum]|uniref:Uncharacterized protein n=1 Tax=Papaver atlanticum TaxID=357466 RepID=A0AAD4XVZ5_9MAGN|nr:hypothetical protein MKW98_017075 [Papaver atlanticum]